MLLISFKIHPLAWDPLPSLLPLSEAVLQVLFLGVFMRCDENAVNAVAEFHPVEKQAQKPVTVCPHSLVWHMWHFSAWPLFYSV